MAEKRCPDFSIGIRFRSGKCEKLSLKKNLPYGDRRKHTDNTISKIRELATTMDDYEIAEQLNQDGLEPPEGKSFTYSGIRWIRYKHGISGPYRRNRLGISVREAAALLGTSAEKIYYGIYVGKIPARNFFDLNCSLIISPFFARWSLSSVYLIPSTPSAPLFRTTCRYALLRLSLEGICSIRLLVSMRSFLSVSLDLTTFSPIDCGRYCHFCNTRPTQTY